MTQPLIVAVDVGATKTLLTVRSTHELEAGWRPDGPIARSDSHADPVALVHWVEAEVARSTAESMGVASESDLFGARFC